MSLQLSTVRNIVITGGSGFLGRHVVEELEKRDVPPDRIRIPRSRNHDLRIAEMAREVIAGADVVIHLAAKVGGIGFNQKFPGELFYDNATMGINVIEACRLEKVKKLVVAGTICAYPRHTPVPFREENLWNGYPEETNAPYGVAKKALLVMLQAYRQQYDFNGIFLLPVNLYGPHDNFDLESSHVIPALIRKFEDARENKMNSVRLWGDGSPTREFVYVADAARALVLATEKYNSSEPVNVGSGNEIAIRDLALKIKKLVGFSGDIEWDKSRPNGQECRRLDVTRAREWFGFASEVSLDQGLDVTYQWWREHKNSSVPINGPKPL